MLAYYNGAEVYLPRFNGTIADYIIRYNGEPDEPYEPTDKETTALLGTAVLGKMILGEEAEI